MTLVCGGCCFIQPLAPGWGCSAGNYTCVFGGDGGAKTKALCQASCKKPPHKPGTPAGLIGKWRGIGIQHTYKYGEWDGEFNATAFNFKGPDGTLWSAQVFTGGPEGAQVKRFHPPRSTGAASSACSPIICVRATAS